jgi:hypothetical protein
MRAPGIRSVRGAEREDHGKAGARTLIRRPERRVSPNRSYVRNYGRNLTPRITSGSHVHEGL